MATYPVFSEYKPRAILLGVQRQEKSDIAQEASMNELARLVETLGYDVEESWTQKREELCVSTVVGKGKLEELKLRLEERSESVEEGVEEPTRGRKMEEEARRWVVVLNESLTPRQFRTLEKELEVEVLDRTGVILSIFQRHARSRVSRIQVELASLNAVALRAGERRGKNMDQQAGGIGAKGLGEAAHKLEKRWVRNRTALLKRQLKGIEKEHARRCERRQEVPSVALVGYTNAGKSTLMKALTQGDVLVEDKLFATLGTTIRSLTSSSSGRILLSDTVGFIEDLPHELVASFHSTLEEARQASLLLQVVDASAVDVERQLKVTRDVLAVLDASQVPSLLVLNKVDRLDSDRRETLELMYPKALFVSALADADIARVRNAIEVFFEGEMREEALFIPYEKHHLVSQVHDSMRVLGWSFEDEGTSLSVKATACALDDIYDRLALI